MQAVNISREGESTQVSGAVTVQRIGILCKANKDGGRWAMTSAAPRVVGCLELDRFHVPPHPHETWGSGKTGAVSAPTLYVTIHSPSRVPGNFPTTF